MSTRTRGQSVGKAGWIVALAGAAAIVAGCDQGTQSAQAPAAPANAGPSAIPQQVASSGPLSRMRDNPTSMLGKTAQMGKDTVQMALNRDSAIGGMAAEMSGEAVPLQIAGLHWSVPVEWERVQSDSTMRAAEFRIPHQEGGEGEAQAIWYHFGPGQGGTVEENIARWATFVRDADGNPTIPDIATMKINGIRTTLVAMEGTYRDGLPGQTYVERPGYAFYGAIFEGRQGNVFIRLTGPVDVVNSLLGQWQQLFQGTRPDNM